MTKDLDVIVVTGPTASGKTKASISLAKKLNGEIISADSRAVYKGFDIVSAKPTLEEREGVVHHLIDIINPDCDFSAGDFVKHSKEIIENITSKGKRVIITGGTWFYIKALLDKKALPPIPSNQNLRCELEKYSNEELWLKLSSLDKKRGDEINKNNREKIIRSIEMCMFLNAPISEYKNEENNLKSVWFMPSIDREELYQKINLRVDLMVEKGLYEEFEKMINKWGKDNKLIKNTIGYQEFLEYENKSLAIEKIKQHTRNFAKRQLTYFRSNKDIKTLPLNELSRLQDI